MVYWKVFCKFKGVLGKILPFNRNASRPLGKITILLKNEIETLLVTKIIYKYIHNFPSQPEWNPFLWKLCHFLWKFNHKQNVRLHSHALKRCRNRILANFEMFAFQIKFRHIFSSENGLFNIPFFSKKAVSTYWLNFYCSCRKLKKVICVVCTIFYVDQSIRFIFVVGHYQHSCIGTLELIEL